MAIRQGGFSRKSKASQEIPSSSLADIAFLLLIFFMVTTVFRTTSPRPIEWPEAEAAQKVKEKREDILNIWLERGGAVYLNDSPIAMEAVDGIVGPLYQQSNQELVISIRGDRSVPYHFLNDLQEELMDAGVQKVVFATELERRMQRAQR